MVVSLTSSVAKPGGKLHIIHVTDKPFPPSADDGGAPQFVGALSESLQRNGNEVQVATTSQSVDSNALSLDSNQSLSKQLERLVLDKSIDIVHFHAHGEQLQPDLDKIGVPTVCHMHGDHYGVVSGTHNDLYVSRAHAARHGATAFVYNGVDLNFLPFISTPEEHFVFLGKVRRSKKGADIAVAVAKKMRRPLTVIGGRKFSVPETWLPVSRYVRAVGVLDGERKLRALSRAKALLFPIRWEEPFGLVLIEAMACGVPVIAFNRGAVPEIVKDGVTGFVVDDFEQMCEAVERIDEIDRAACRDHVAAHFSIERTAEGVEEYYRRAIAGEIW